MRDAGLKQARVNVFRGLTPDALDSLIPGNSVLEDIDHIGFHTLGAMRCSLACRRAGL